MRSEAPGMRPFVAEAADAREPKTPAEASWGSSGVDVFLRLLFEDLQWRKAHWPSQSRNLNLIKSNRLIDAHCMSQNQWQLFGKSRKPGLTFTPLAASSWCACTMRWTSLPEWTMAGSELGPAVLLSLLPVDIKMTSGAAPLVDLRRSKCVTFCASCNKFSKKMSKIKLLLLRTAKMRICQNVSTLPAWFAWICEGGQNQHRSCSYCEYDLYSMTMLLRWVLTTMISRCLTRVHIRSKLSLAYFPT